MGKVVLRETAKKPRKGKSDVSPQVYTFGNDPKPPLSGAVPTAKGQVYRKDFVVAAAAIKAPAVTQDNSYRVEDILRMGKENFFKKASPKSPIPIPDLDFSDEEKAAIDKLFAGK